MSKYLVGIIFFLIGFKVSGQQVTRLGLEANYGFIIPHSPDLRPISNSNPTGVAAHYQWMPTNKRAWDICNCFHYRGIQASYHSFGNPDVLGSAITISGTFEPILWEKARWRLSLLSGFGISYLTNVFDEQTNPDNLFLSSSLSFLIFASPKIEYVIHPDWSVHFSFAYNHISNGGQQQPNKGINYPMLGFGVNKYFNRPVLPDYEAEVLERNWKGYLELGVTTREAAWTEGRKPTISFAGGTKRSVSRINALGGGIEVTKDFALEIENSRIEAIMPAPFIAHHFELGRFDFSQRFAMYTYKPADYIDHRFYQRYVLLYNFIDELKLGFSLKVHGHVAENIDLRASWNF